MKKTNKTFKTTVFALIGALMFIPAVISCATPEDPTKNNNNNNTSNQESQNAELESKRLQKKIEIYNKMLGNWEDPESIIIEGKMTYDTATGYFSNSYGLYKEILHIEPTKWYWSCEGSGEDNIVIKTWDKPFYNYIYLFEEWNTETFGENNIVRNRLNNSANPDSKKNENYIYINIKDFYAKDSLECLFNISNLQTRLTMGVDTLVRSTTTGNDNGGEQGGTGGSSGGESINLSGTWNYAVPDQANAGGTVTFENGTIKFKHKVGSLTSEASYKLSGDTMSIEYMSFKENFKVTKNGSSLTFAYTGSENISQILGGFFQYMNSDKKITLTK